MAVVFYNGSGTITQVIIATPDQMATVMNNVPTGLSAITVPDSLVPGGNASGLAINTATKQIITTD